MPSCFCYVLISMESPQLSAEVDISFSPKSVVELKIVRFALIHYSKEPCKPIVIPIVN